MCGSFSAHHHDLKNLIGKSTLWCVCCRCYRTTNFATGVVCWLYFVCSVAGVKTFAYIASGVCFRIFISLISIHLCASMPVFECARNFTIYHSFNHSSFSTIICPKYLILLYVCYEVHKLLHRYEQPERD